MSTLSHVIIALFVCLLVGLFVQRLIVSYIGDNDDNDDDLKSVVC